MKYLLLLAVLLTSCATEHRPPAREIGSVYIDCTNKDVFERYFAQQLSLTNMQRVESDPTERQYYAAIKDRLWTLRSTCR